MSEFFKYGKIHANFFKLHGESTTYQKGHQLVRPGEANEFVYYLLDGLVKVSFCIDDGSERIIGYFIPTMLFAQLGSFYNKSDSGLEFSAITDISVIRLPRKLFIEQLKKDNAFALEYINRLSYNQIYHVDRTIYQGERGIRNKTIRWLLFMAKFYGKTINDDQVEIYIPITQETAANFLHSTRESVSSTLHSLNKKGLISTCKKKTTILSLKNLSAELS